ncbi:MAG: hypothetical protein ACLQF0_16965 [Dissulfurispiraceae bacterium]
MAKNLFKDVDMGAETIKAAGKGADMVKAAGLRAQHKGRPRKAETDRALSQVTVYFTEDEKRRLDEYMRGRGGVSISSFVKLLLVEKGAI